MVENAAAWAGLEGQWRDTQARVELGLFLRSAGGC